jgi:hypothetical protein
MSVPYMVIGGLAAMRWAEPRATVDVDVVVWVDDDERDGVIERLSRALKPRPKHSPEFFERTRVLLLQSSSGVDLDVLFALLPYEWEAIQRAVDFRLPLKITLGPIQKQAAEVLWCDGAFGPARS